MVLIDGTRVVLMAYHTPKEETLDRERLADLQHRKFGRLISEILASNQFYQGKIGDSALDPEAGRLEQLPLTTRSEIERDQLDHPPYGSLLTYPLEQYTRLHETSGTSGAPLRWLDTKESWNWLKHCWCIVYRGAGVTAEDRLIFPFSFGPFIGFWAAFEAATDLGNFCLPAGGMTTTARLEYMLDHAVTVVCCTPTYALRMAEVADREGIDLRSSSVRLLIVAGEPGGSIPAVRSRIEEDWCARVIDHVGMTEIGAYGFECVEAPGGLHVIESEFVAEVIDPTTCEVLPDGRVGELVLTNLGRRGSPLIRYRTGDQVVLTRDRCRCGRWFARIEGGIRGRLDDMLIIRGNNVFPSAIEGLLREYREVVEYRLVVDRAGSMADLHIEVEPDPKRDAGDLAQRIETSVRDRFHFKPRVTLVSAGSLPRFEMKARRLIRNDR